MASPLTATLLGGSDPNVGSMDPNIVALQPELTLAQSLLKSGVDTSPASPWQALARIAQAGAGTYLQKGVTSDLAQAYANTAANAAKTLPPTHPLRAALLSSDPSVRMQGLAAYKQAMTLMSEPQKLGTDQMSWIGGAPVAGFTPQAQVGFAGQKAGAEAAAKAPFEAGGEGIVTGPDGVPRKVQLTAATRAGMQPQGAPLVPTPVPTTTITRLPAGPGAAPPNPATVPPGGAAPNPAAPPQGALGAGPVSGIPLPNPAIGPSVEADTKEVAAHRDMAAKGQQDMATVRAIQDFLPKVATGWSGDTRLEAGRILKAAGVPDSNIQDFLKTDVASGQILQKKFLELSAGAARTMGAREPGSVISMFAKAYPNLGTDPQAVTLQTNALYMDRLRQQQLAEESTNTLNKSINDVQTTGQYKGLTGFNEQFNKNHPAESYFSAAEAMSGLNNPWKRITDQGQQTSVINLIPPGMTFMAPSWTDKTGFHPERMVIKPGSGVQQ